MNELTIIYQTEVSVYNDSNFNGLPFLALGIVPPPKRRNNQTGAPPTTRDEECLPGVGILDNFVLM